MYQLSKHLISILAPLVGKSASHVRNSAEFASFIVGQSHPSGTMLVSFDVVSLFTRVPAALAVKVIHERRTVDTSLVTSLSADQVVQLLQFCLDAMFLAYKGDVYQYTGYYSPVCFIMSKSKQAVKMLTSYGHSQ